MNIRWKFKSKIFGYIDKYKLEGFLYFLQKYVTRRSSKDLTEIDNIWKKHVDVIKNYYKGGTSFEFGAGKSLAQNLFLSQYLDKQVVVDLNHMLDFELVEKARLSLKSLSVLFKSDVPISGLSDLSTYGIDYIAPYDARNTDFHDESVHLCLSTNTLEHIPKEDLMDIFNELSRVLAADGVVSARVDYSDHYAHTDNRISLLNFLNFDDDQWSIYNHQCHFQNRLRHYDYVEVFEKCGFQVLEENLDFDEKSIPAELIRRYADRPESWSATSCHFVLRKSS